MTNKEFLSGLTSEQLVEYLQAEHVEEPKNCPHCGGKSQVDKSFSGAFQVKCTRCYTATPWKESKESAIKVWNKRVGDDNDKL